MHRTIKRFDSMTLSLQFLRFSLSGARIFTDVKSIPKGKRIATHELLQSLGFVKQPSAGLVNWMPLGLKVLRKIETIIRGRMDAAGFEEVSLSALSAAALWKKTGRWNNSELFKLGKNQDFCLAATCEEEITETVKNAVTSYKSLPLKLYQISRKYRDEKRPRSGLLRGREFVMKDGYSFDADKQGALESYNSVNDAYRLIFEDLKVPFVSAKADTGDIGGNLSLEWHYKHLSGEDVLMECTSCSNVSNIEKATSLPLPDAPSAAEANAWYFVTADNNTLVAMYYPKGRKLMASFAKAEIEDLVLELGSSTVPKSFLEDPEGLAVKNVIRVLDPRVGPETKLPDFPGEVKFQRNSFTSFNDISIVAAEIGEVCGDCETGYLNGSPAIEVGHTFLLGQRYSVPLDGKFKNRESKSQYFEMGCYGIGVSRLVAAIAEVCRDETGLVWPNRIAPYSVSLIQAPSLTQSLVELKDSLVSAGIQTRYDGDKNQPLGLKISESKMLGIPLLVLVGKRFPEVEIEVRSRILATTELWKTDKQKADFDWKVETDKFEKHIVHISNAVTVITALLRDL